MNPKKLFYASALIASGLLNVAQLGGIADANAKAKTEPVSVSSNHLSTSAKLQAIKAEVKDLHCAKAETQEDMLTDSCKVTPGSKTCFYWGDDSDVDSRTIVDTTFEFAALLTFDPDQP